MFKKQESFQDMEHSKLFGVTLDKIVFRKLYLGGAKWWQTSVVAGGVAAWKISPSLQILSIHTTSLLTGIIGNKIEKLKDTNRSRKIIWSNF